MKLYSLLLIFFVLSNQALLGRATAQQTVLATKPAVVSNWYSTGDKVPGDPSNGTKNLRLIYKLINIYRSRHEGIYPSSLADIRKDARSGPQTYGFEDMKQFQTSVTNPDNKYADSPFLRSTPDLLTSTILLDKRSDGSLVGSPKPIGTKDVLAYTNIYVHRNRFLTEGNPTYNPVGFYMVLWDDGQIEKVPYDQVLYSRIKDGYIVAFPGEAATLPLCLSYAEYQVKFRPNAHTSIIGYPLAENQAEPVADNGGYESLVALSRLLSAPLEREPVWDTLGREQKTFLLSDVQLGAAKLDLPLQLRTAPLSELQQLNAPAIFMTSDDKRIVTLSNLDDKDAIVIDQGLTRIVSRELLAQRYGGEALLPQSATAPSSVVAEDPIRIITLRDKTTEITQQVKITNRGTQPLTLQIERPIPGVTQAELSADTVAPGQSATLSLKIKWRDILKGDTQNVFVFLKTNDSVRPRLQLGFELKAPQAKTP